MWQSYDFGLLVLMFSSSCVPGPMNSLMGNFNKYMEKAEVFAGNIWSHSKLHQTTFATHVLDSCIFSLEFCTD